MTVITEQRYICLPAERQQISSHEQFAYRATCLSVNMRDGRPEVSSEVPRYRLPQAMLPLQRQILNAFIGQDLIDALPAYAEASAYFFRR